MRSLQVFIVTLCLFGGLYLLIHAPGFFLVDRWDAAIGHRFEPPATRLLGAGLLTLAAAGVGYLRQFYSPNRARPTLRWQRLHFALLIVALLLLGLAQQAATPGPNPDYRPRAHDAS